MQIHYILQTYIHMHAYVVGMSMNATGMSIHPFLMGFLCFGRKIPSLLDFDDVITLHH